MPRANLTPRRFDNPKIIADMGASALCAALADDSRISLHLGGTTQRRSAHEVPRGPVKIAMTSGIIQRSHALAIAVIDGPYDASALSGVLADVPLSLAAGSCAARPNSACDHGTFILALLGARRESELPGLCPECRLIHIPLFVDASSPVASVDDLATAIATAVNSGARLINLSLAILGTGSEVNHRLAAALDLAEARGAVLLAAAGNQGHLATGQLLRHPVVVPVVAADASQRLLPDSNFGPAIVSRGVATLGRMPGYAPGGGMTVMSGTSVAAAVATGILAQVWSEHPDIDGAALRSAIARLGPRAGSTPPIMNRDLVLSALGRVGPSAIAAHGAVEMTSYAMLQGATIMANGDGQPVLAQGAGPIARPAPMVTPAEGGCGCGAPGGACTCIETHDVSGFVYAIGTIEADYPNIAIEREMLALADHLGVKVTTDRDPNIRPTEDRHWQYAVLSKDRKRTRYIARQLRWRLTIEDFSVFVLNPSDPNYLDDLIDALDRPKYAKPEPHGGKREAKEALPTEATGLPVDLDVVVGLVGRQTPHGITVLVDQIFQIKQEQCAPSGLPYFAQVADNHGLTDADRAYNFLVARRTPPPSTVEKFELSGMRVAPSRLSSGVSRIVRAIYTYTNASGAQKEYFVRVDVTHEFPMLVSPLQLYLERGEGL